MAPPELPDPLTNLKSSPNHESEIKPRLTQAEAENVISRFLNICQGSRSNRINLAYASSLIL